MAADGGGLGVYVVVLRINTNLRVPPHI